MEGMLSRFKIEIEVCGPDSEDAEEMLEGFLQALMSGTDCTEMEDVFAIGEMKIIPHGKISIDEWNGDDVAIEED